MDKVGIPEGLRKRVLTSIRKEEIRRARVYVICALMAGLSSIVGIVFSIAYIARAISQSSFYQYFSLLFSDADIVRSYWKSFGMSLVESMPFFATTLVLFAVVVLMMSVRVFIKNSGRNFSPSFSN